MVIVLSGQVRADGPAQSTKKAAHPDGLEYRVTVRRPNWPATTGHPMNYAPDHHNNLQPERPVLSAAGNRDRFPARTNAAAARSSNPAWTATKTPRGEWFLTSSALAQARGAGRLASPPGPLPRISSVPGG